MYTPKQQKLTDYSTPGSNIFIDIARHDKDDDKDTNMYHDIEVKVRKFVRNRTSFSTQKVIQKVNAQSKGERQAVYRELYRLESAKKIVKVNRGFWKNILANNEDIEDKVHKFVNQCKDRFITRDVVKYVGATNRLEKQVVYRELHNLNKAGKIAKPEDGGMGDWEKVATNTRQKMYTVLKWVAWNGLWIAIAAGIAKYGYH